MTPFDMGFLLGGAALLLLGLLVLKWNGVAGMATGLVMVLIVVLVKVLDALGWRDNWTAIIVGSVLVASVGAYISTRN